MAGHCAAPTNLKASDLELEQGWFEGRPVLVTRNDYGLGLMNGDIGITRARDWLTLVEMGRGVLDEAVTRKVVRVSRLGQL